MTVWRLSGDRAKPARSLAWQGGWRSRGSCESIVILVMVCSSVTVVGREPYHLAFDLRLGGRWILLLMSWKVRYGRVVRVSGLEDASLTAEVPGLVFYCSVEEWKDEWKGVDSSELKSQHWPKRYLFRDPIAEAICY